jgi:hypothetical protein
MTATLVKTEEGQQLSSGCALENIALSATLRELAQRPKAMQALEYLEVTTSCDGCDSRDACEVKEGER